MSAADTDNRGLKGYATHVIDDRAHPGTRAGWECRKKIIQAGCIRRRMFRQETRGTPRWETSELVPRGNCQDTQGTVRPFFR